MTMGSPRNPISMTTGAQTGGAVGGTSAALALPACNVCHVTVSTPAVVLLGPSTATVTTGTGILVTPDSGGIIFDRVGHTHIASIRVALNGLAAADGLICVAAVR